MYLLLIIIIAIYLILNIRIRRDKFNKIMNKDDSIKLRGLFAIIILLGHLTYNFNNEMFYYRIILWFLYLLVGFYMFQSGYGLTASLKKNENYLNNFWKQRIGKIIIPYIECILIFGLMSICFNSDYNIIQFIKDTFLCQKLGPYWYIISILVLYLIFYISHKSKVKRKELFIAVLNMGFAIFLYLFSFSAHWYISILSFSFGVFYHKYEEEINNYINYKTIFISILLFLVIFIMDKYVSFKNLNIGFLDVVVKNALCLTFNYIIVCLFKYIKFNGKLLDKIGNISYEIYLTHPLIFAFIPKFNSNSLLVLVILFVVLLSSYFMNCVNREVKI